MSTPLKIKLQSEETPLARSVVLSVRRLEATIATRRIAYGVVLTLPVAVYQKSPSTRVRQLVLDPLVALRAVALGGLVFLAAAQVVRKR
jgi:hypothetical protein